MSLSYPIPRAGVRGARRTLAARPELLVLVGVAAGLNLWGLTVNGWANTYYSAAVRSMASSWHNFLFASLDPAGLMTVDKPPLSLWVQALSVRVFGFHPLSMLVPQALMGVFAVGLLYDLVRRHFGRAAGFAAGFALATTPVIVAVSRHNNPDELLVLCSVAAAWCAVRALEERRAKWLVLSGVCVGLGFETKMLVALVVVPAIAAAWLWTAPERGRLRAVRQLLAGGAAMGAVGLAWPLLVMLTPAGDRPWISGTSDNSIWSLIFGYNGVGRVAGQSGGPAGGVGTGPGGGAGGSLFGGPTGFFRLLQSGLGDQAGWLLGFAAVAGLALLVLTRLRRRDQRTGWLIVIGGTFVTTAATFSFARGIFHPYYVSLLAPFTAALIGAGVGTMLGTDRSARLIAPIAIGAGAVTELVVLGQLGGQLAWARPLMIVVAGACGVALAFSLSRRARAVVVGVALAALFAAPATWAAQTLGHATNGTFPTGGPASAIQAGGHASFGGAPAAGARLGGGPPGGSRLGGGPPGGSRFGGAPPGGSGFGGAPPGGSRFAGAPPTGANFGGAPPGAAGAGMFGASNSTLTAAISYARTHGGGTIAVSSQSGAAAAILSSNADVAGLGGFSGRESSVSVSWLAGEVKAGRLRWVIVDQGGGFRLAGDNRAGSQAAMTAVQKACRSVSLPNDAGTIYDCQGRAAAILQAGAAQ